MNHKTPTLNLRVAHFTKTGRRIIFKDEEGEPKDGAFVDQEAESNKYRKVRSTDLERLLARKNMFSFEDPQPGDAEVFMRAYSIK